MHASEDSLRFPSGRTVGDCRKDAKRLARSTGISLSAAQDQVAIASGAERTWSLSIEALKRRQPTIMQVAGPAWSQMTADDVKTVLKREPLLTRSGYGTHDEAIKKAGSFGAAIEAGQAALLDHIEECNKALRFLQHVDKRKTINDRVGSSYGLKHQAEAYLERVDVDRPQNAYIANGSFICAALHAGFTMKVSAHLGPNVTFNMSSRSPIFAWRHVVDRSAYGDPALRAKKARLAQNVGTSFTRNA